MTNAERTLLLAFIDNLISQATALRGAIGVLGRDEKVVPVEKTEAGNEAISDAEFSKRYNAMMESIKKGNEDGDEAE